MKVMKNTIIKTIVFIGFLVTVLGVILDPLIAEDSATVAGVFVLVPFLPLYIILASVFGVAFVHSKSETLANVGYGLMAFGGAIGIGLLARVDYFSLIVIPVGLIIMFVGSVLKAVVLVVGFFGFVKADADGREPSDDIVGTLTKYKELENDGVLSEEEFGKLKTGLVEREKTGKVTIEDLKKWRKLVDQKVISEEEFAAMKANFFAE